MSSLKGLDITIRTQDGHETKMSGEEFERRTTAIVNKNKSMDTTSVIPQRETRSLRYDFTAVETHELSIMLAATSKKLNSLKEEKKSVDSEFKAKMDKAQEQINTLSNQVSNGFEYRDVECSVEYHKPEQGKKSLTRSDNGEVIVEKMQPFEWNLFTQVEDTVEDRLQDESPLGNDDKPKRKRNSKKTEELFQDPNDLNDIL